MKHSLLSALLFFAVTGCGLCPSLGEEVRVKVPATANPWLAGEPEGTTCSGDQTASSPKPDSVPGQAPVSVEGLELEKGGSLFFDATGGAHIGPAPESLFSGPDGRLLEGGKLEFGKRPPLLGKTGVTAPMVSLLGLFLGETGTSSISAHQKKPSSFDFSDRRIIDRRWFAPALGQVFYIGDGSTTEESGLKFRQSWSIPDGAGRLYLGIMDGAEWSNNPGEFVVRCQRMDFGLRRLDAEETRIFREFLTGVYRLKQQKDRRWMAIRRETGLDKIKLGVTSDIAERREKGGNEQLTEAERKIWKKWKMSIDLPNEEFIRARRAFGRKFAAKNGLTEKQLGSLRDKANSRRLSKEEQAIFEEIFPLEFFMDPEFDREIARSAAKYQLPVPVVEEIYFHGATVWALDDWKKTHGKQSRTR